MQRVIIDTSSLIAAALNPRGLPADVLKHAYLTSELLISTDTYSELVNVLHRPKLDRYFKKREMQQAVFLGAYLDNALLVEITQVSEDCRDPNDNQFLSLALSGSADLIVSSDSDLLVLNPYKGISILTVQQYAEREGLRLLD